MSRKENVAFWISMLFVAIVLVLLVLNDIGIL
jgi:hypothetical protein